MYDDDDGVGATGTIVVPLLPTGVKFTITRTMLQILTLKRLFDGAVSEDTNQHIIHCVAICQSFEISSVS